MIKLILTPFKRSSLYSLLILFTVANCAPGRIAANSFNADDGHGYLTEPNQVSNLALHANNAIATRFSAGDNFLNESKNFYLENARSAGDEMTEAKVFDDKAIESTMEYSAICPAPIITAQPQSTTTCTGSSVTFSVIVNINGAGTIVYQWRKGGTNISGATNSSYTIASVTITNAGNYDVVVTKSCGVKVTSLAATLSINNLDAGTIGSDQNICSGADAAPLTSIVDGSGSGVVTYQWEESPDNSSWSAIAGATDANYDPGALTASNFYRRTTASLLNGITCSTSSNVVSVVVDLPQATISSNSPLCEGSLLSLSLSSGASYTWTGPNGFTSSDQNPSISNVTLDASGSYSVTLTDANGCTVIATTPVTINPKPNATASNNSPLCEGGSLSLSSCGGSTFSWVGPSGFTSSDKNPSITNVILANAGDYEVTVTNSYGCTASTITTVIVNPNPTATASNNSPSCEGGSVSLTSSGGDSYSWAGPDGFTSSDQNPNINNASSTTSGTYVVTVTNAYGCTAIASTTVTINSIPPISISASSEINEGGLLSLSATGGVSYLWEGPNGFISTDQTPTITNATVAATGTYTVTVTSADGCSNSATTTVTVIAAPAAGATSNSPSDEGSTIQLSAEGGVSYYWEGPNGYTSTEQYATISDASLADAGTYTVTITTADNETFTSTTDVVIYPMPTASATTPVCEGSTLNLSGTGGVSYSWTGPNGFASTEENPIISAVSLADAGDYTVIVTRSDGSTRTATTTVNVNPIYNVTEAPVTACDSYTLPWGQTATFSGDYSHVYSSVDGCDSTITIHVTVNTSYNVAGASVSACDSYTLAWGTVVTSTGDYSHTYTSLNGCDSIITHHVTINPSYNIQTDPIVACESYALPWGTVATSTGDYSQTYSSVSGCDSTVTTHVTINSAYNVTSAPVSACGSYTLPWDDVVNSSGNYSHTYSSVTGCDSVVSIFVTVNPTYDVVGIPVTACGSYTLPWGTTVTTTGNYSHVYTSGTGCDSTVTIHITINPSYYVVASPVYGCDNYTLPWGDFVTITDDYSHLYSSITGCDSFVVIHVTINSSYNVTSTSATACDNYTLPWGQNVTSTGDYSHTYLSVTGCDSIVTTHVTINNSAASSLNATACDTYTLPWGDAVTASGNYSHTYATVNGCDSVVTAHVTINNSAASSFNATACDSYTLPWGNAVTASGNYTHTYATVNGCDSVVTAHITIHNSATSSFNATACDSYTLPWGGAVTASGDYSHTYTTINGCDSVVTAHVTINASPTANATGNVACAGSTLNLTSSGGTTYSWAGPNGFTSSDQNPGIANVTSAAAGTYTVTVTNANGCSSTATAEATVSVASATASGSAACIGGTLTLSANSGSSYSWTGPNGFISTLQNPTISNITSAAAGTYNVAVTNSFGCSATASATVAVYSNPTATASSNSPVSGGSTLYLYSSGGTSYSWAGPDTFLSTLQNPSIAGVTWLAAGTYTVTVTNANGCTATATTTVVVNCAGFKSYTYTQGGWGATPSGNNPAVYRNQNFPYAFPNGLTVGNGPYYLYLTTSQAVQDFLPSGSTPAVLTQSYTNPGSSLSNALAGQVAALALNIGFDNYDASFSHTSILLKDLFIKSGTFMGWTVQQVFDEAMKKLGGGTSSYTASALNTACTNINQNYDGGTTDKGYLSCIPVRVANPVDGVTEQSNLNVYPNPSNGLFIIDLNLNNESDCSVDIQILNMLGQTVYADRTIAVNGKLKQEVKFDRNDADGNYFLRVTSGDKMLTQPIILQK